MEIKVLNGNNIELLKQYPDNYFDAIVTDPPYGLGKEPNAQEMLQAWITEGYLEVKGGGFMGKEWDAFVPQPIFWKEVFRVLKHGGHIVAFYGTRTYDWGVMAMRLAGFEIRDCIQWIYGSGFPKSHNRGKAVDKIKGNVREVTGERLVPNQRSGGINSQRTAEIGFTPQITISETKGQSEWEGWGTALKPANEPIVLARKPLEKGLTIAQNVLKWGKGAINIDACRVTLSENDDSRLGGNGSWTTDKMAKNTYEGGFEGREIQSSNLGRFPANLILTHHPECQCNGLKKVKPNNGSGNASENGGGFSKGMFGNGESDRIGGGFIDENGQETIEDWTCHEDCPIRIMDEQSFAMGIHSAGVKRDKKVTSEYNNTSFHAPTLRQMNRFGDKGGASRFFYVAKASKSERNKGLEEFEEKPLSDKKGQGLRRICDICGAWILEPCNCENNSWILPSTKKNFHPTVKPVALMRYLVKMITPPNGIVLDPFNGSGTTGVACKLDGFNYVGMEQDAEFCKISESRIAAFLEQDLEYEIIPKTNDGDISDNELKNQLSLFE